MSGTITAAVVGVVGLGVGMYEASQQQGIEKQALGLSATQGQKQNQAYMQLQQLIQDPSSYLKSPLFQSSLDTGLQGVTRQTQAMGLKGSGNQMTALEQFGQSFASNQLLSQEELLAGMSGTGFNPAGSLSVGSSAGSQSFQQLGTLLYALGQTSGSGGFSSFGSGGGGGANFDGSATFNSGFSSPTPGYS